VKADGGVHLDLAVEILKAILSETSSVFGGCYLQTDLLCSMRTQLLTIVIEETRKTLLSFLGKLNLPEPEEAEESKLKAAKLLLNNIRSVSLRIS
jgi:hypothetical protein